MLGLSPRDTGLSAIAKLRELSDACERAVASKRKQKVANKTKGCTRRSSSSKLTSYNHFFYLYIFIFILFFLLFPQEREKEKKNEWEKLKDSYNWGSEYKKRILAAKKRLWEEVGHGHRDTIDYYPPLIKRPSLNVEFSKNNNYKYKNK